MVEKYELIITEKPKVGQRVAEALSTGKVEQKKRGKVSYYIIERNGKQIVIAPAVGHVYTLKEEKGTTGYPIFNTNWIPSYEANKNSAFTKPYVETLKTLAKKADSFVSACDYDVEGELIGYNVLKFICGKGAEKNAKRMKFSALTKEELAKSYDNLLENLDFNLVDAGITRHTLDWFWGINTSRALSYAYKSVTGAYLTLSAGRVQTPTLKILDDRETEIKKFIPEPFWVISALLKTEPKELTIIHETERFFKKEEADTAHENCKGNNAIVQEIIKRRIEQKPPFPFNLGDLQSESYKVFRYSPKRTQIIAQNLYEQGLISYPRTSSQRLPKGVTGKAMLKKISKLEKYTSLVNSLLDKNLTKPNEGSKTDPAHPCIYPTGELPKKLTEQDTKLFDLIVKRFLASYGKPAVREMQVIKFKISDETFLAKGAVTIEENWHEFYKPYVKLKEEELPELSENQEIEVQSLDMKEDKTKPPGRYSQASIIKKMEQLGIGTKATRAQILQTLYDRNYVIETQITVTGFGSMIVETLAEYVPELTSEQLTKKFEEEMKQIREGSLEKDKVIEDAKQTLEKIIGEFKKNQEKIGLKLKEQYRETAKVQRTIGPCPKCGADLIIRVSKKTRKQFIGCSAYPKCTCSYPLPQSAKIVKIEKNCEHDNLPIIEVRRKGKRRFSMCIDPKCKSKADWGKKKKK